jgi:oligopeptide/dipeptide ABC transporter ATP-binding protein
VSADTALAADGAAAPLLSISDLRVELDTDDGVIAAVDGVTVDLPAGGCLGIVGESGCGKSITALAIMGLLPRPKGRVARGRILFEGRDLTGLPDREMRPMRGRNISMIFQEPMTSLNPAFTIGDQLVEAIVVHERVSAAAGRAHALELLRQVRIPAPEERFFEYPHKLSGGMRQRVMIAMALACRPRLLIADEPTTALDVTIQAQILDLLRMLKDEIGTAILLISHNLGVVAELADQVAVMYAGRVVERAPVHRLFDHPEHPYTIGLLGAVPRLDGRAERLVSIEGMVPDALSRPDGCGFAPRCPFALEKCAASAPPYRPVGPRHESACWAAPLEAVP